MISTPAPPSSPVITPQPSPSPAAPVPARKTSFYGQESPFFNVYTVAPRSGVKPVATRCQVGFMNLSGSNVTLQIDGKTYRLPPKNCLDLQTSRQFVWQVAGRQAIEQQVPADEIGVDIVIRR